MEKLSIIKRVLIIEDNVIKRLNYIKLLEESTDCPYPVQCVSPDNYEDVLLEIQTKLFSSVLMDFSLWDGITAIDILKVVRQSQPYTGVVIVTGVTINKLVKAGIDTSGIICLQKGSDDNETVLDAVISSIDATDRRTSNVIFQKEIFDKLTISENRRLDDSKWFKNQLNTMKKSVDDLNLRIENNFNEDSKRDDAILTLSNAFQDVKAKTNAINSFFMNWSWSKTLATLALIVTSFGFIGLALIDKYTYTQQEGDQLKKEILITKKDHKNAIIELKDATTSVVHETSKMEENFNKHEERMLEVMEDRENRLRQVEAAVPLIEKIWERVEKININ